MKRCTENVRRRIEHEIKDGYSVGVAVFLKDSGQYHTCRSIDRLTGPPSIADIESDIRFRRVQLTSRGLAFHGVLSCYVTILAGEGFH